jgi:N-acetylglucosamine repressor
MATKIQWMPMQRSKRAGAEHFPHASRIISCCHDHSMQGRTQNMRLISARPGKTEKPKKLVQNELDVLQFIHTRINSSRVELAREVGLSAASMTAIVHDLLEKRLVVESGRESSTLGRKPVSLSIRSDAAYLLGVDLGSYFLRVVITDLNGKIAYKRMIETRIADGQAKVMDRMCKFIRLAMKDSGLPRGAIKGIGIGHSGVIDSERGVILSYPRPGQMSEWKNLPMRDMLEKEFGIPCLLEDSVRASAIAERSYGFGKDLKEFIYIEVGIGIGAGIFLDGKLYRGAGGSAGEFGHVTVDEDGPLCSCGNTGCLEAVASCSAIIQAVRRAIDKGVDSRIRDLAGGDLDRISVELIAQAAFENDSLAFRVLQDAVSHIGTGLANMVNLLNPSVLIFGGGLFRAAPQSLLDPLKRIIKQRSLEKSANEVRLIVSQMGTEAGAIGAARLISQKILTNLYFEVQ